MAVAFDPAAFDGAAFDADVPPPALGRPAPALQVSTPITWQPATDPPPSPRADGSWLTVPITIVRA